MSTTISIPASFGARIDYVYDPEAEKRNDYYADPIGAVVTLTFGGSLVGKVTVTEERFARLVGYMNTSWAEEVETETITETVAEALRPVLFPGSAA